MVFSLVSHLFEGLSLKVSNMWRKTSGKTSRGTCDACVGPPGDRQEREPQGGGDRRASRRPSGTAFVSFFVGEMLKKHEKTIKTNMGGFGD